MIEAARRGKERRRGELIRRGRIDPIRLDKRPLHEIMNDGIPYARWQRERQVISHAGYDGWNDWLYGALCNDRKK